MQQSPAEPNPNDIAIVGMSCRFPGADDVSLFWRKLEQEIESISFFSEADLLAAGVAPGLLADPSYVRAGAVIDDIDCFDAAFFGYSPREASLIDPQQRIFLELAWEALERAGYAPQSHGAATAAVGAVGVFGGSAMNAYLINNLATRPDLVPDLFDFQIQLGNDKDYLTSRVSYKLDLGGPSINVQTACSTSLTAIHVACQSLFAGECNMALAGGVSVAVPQRVGYRYQEGGINSADGHCRAFDADARGTLLGSGAGIVVLKRLADALADGDHIHALIRGSAVNNDGSAKVGYTAPSVDGQSAVIAEALAVAGLAADDISYVEAHGTATPVGDPIEIKALTQAFRASSARSGYCAIGSVKTNIGHLDVASGVAGLIKTALMLEHRRIPATLHYRRANPEIDFANSPFYVNTALAEWDQPVRRAGVSSFGLGGSNAHIILEEAPRSEVAKAARQWQLIILSAKTPAALVRIGERLAAHLTDHPEQALADIAYTLQTGRERFRYRRMLICSSRDELAQTLVADERRRSAEAFCDKSERPLVFMFPGQGAQYLGMGCGLYESEPLFRDEVDRCAELLAAHLGADLRRLIWPASAGASGALTDTWIVQPALFVIEYALARLLMSWGVVPTAMIGHSIGEYTALCLAGVMSLADTLKLVAARGRLMQEMQPGSMIAVDLPESELGEIDARGLDLAGVNSPGHCVVAGPDAAIAAFAQELATRGQQSRALHTSHAFHSAMMEPMLERFAEIVAGIALHAPQIPVLSNLTGTWLTAEQATDPDYYSRHLRHTIRFADGVRQAVGDGDLLFVEVGPGRTLGTFAQQCASTPGARGALTTMRHPQQDEPDQAVLLTTLGKLWLAGVKVDWSAFHAGEERHRVPLPGYPFERQRHWIEPGRLRAVADSRPPARTATARQALADWFYTRAWKPGELPAPAITAAEQWLLFSAGDSLGERLAQEIEGSGSEVIWVIPGKQAGWSGDQRYTLNPGRHEDYDRLLESLALAGRLPKYCVHAWNLAPAAEYCDSETFASAQEIGFDSVLRLAQAIGARQQQAPLRISVLGSGIQAIGSAELPAPERAPLVAACVVIAQEYGGLDTRCIDVIAPAAGSAAEDELVRQLLCEMRSDSPEPIIAYRDGVRWLPEYRPLRLDAPAGLPALLREKGVYLISGGLGAIGYALAEELARSAHARLILTGRSQLPLADERDDWLATHSTDDAVSQRIARVRALEALGAEVLVVAADVADSAAMARGLAQANERFGHIDGVIHGAGIIADEAFVAVQDTQAGNCAEHFRPKVAGLLTLHALLRHDAPDFFILLSSISSVIGGLGYAAYAAANLYLDAYALRESRRSKATSWLSIGWDAWLSAAADSDQRGIGASVAELAMSSAEGVDAFRRLLGAGVDGDVIVSTSELGARVEQWVLRQNRNTAIAANDAAGATAACYASEMQRVIAAIWQATLGVGEIEPQDNFFDLGGDSLLLMNVIARLKADHGIVLNPREVLFQTLAQLAAVCEERKGAVVTAESERVSVAPAAAVPEKSASEAKRGLFGALKKKLQG